MPERRNPVVRTGAILRKGGAHTKSVSGQRHRQKLRVDDAIDDWFEEIADHKNGKENNKGQSDTAPSYFLLSISTPVRNHT